MRFTRAFRLALLLFLSSLLCVLLNFGTCLWFSEYCYEEWGITYRLRLRRHSMLQSVVGNSPVQISLNGMRKEKLRDSLDSVDLLNIRSESTPFSQQEKDDDTLLLLSNLVKQEQDTTSPILGKIVGTTEMENTNKFDVLAKGTGRDVSSSLGVATPPEPVSSSHNEEKRLTSRDVALAINRGEMCKTVCPPFEWSQWSPCSRACGKGHRYRKAVYQFICPSHSDLCPDHRLEEETCDIPCLFDPSKYGGPDGLPLYPTNPLNPPIYPEDRDYMCGHWISEYAALHRAILKGERSPSFMVYSTGKGTYPTPGGLADRLKGITTVFFLAVLLDRAFIIEWEDPPGLTDYLAPKYFDWSALNSLKLLNRRPVHDIGSWRAAKESGKSSQWYMNTNFSDYFTKPVEVLQGNRYDYTFALLRNPTLMPKAYELGIDHIRCRICCAFDLLFATSSQFQSSMDQLLQTIGSPPKPYISIHLRARSDDVKSALKTAENYYKCAITASKELHMPHPTIIPIFNNRLIVHIISRNHPAEVRDLVNLPLATRTTHMHLGNIPRDMDPEVHAVVQKRTFQDLFFMLNSTVLVHSKGYLAAFGNVADAIRQHFNPPGSVVTYTVSGTVCLKQSPNSKIE